jgi:hypothetical protein
LSLYIKQIEQLIMLQRLDDEILNLQQTIEDAPEKVTQIESRLETLRNQESELNDKIGMLNEQKRRLTEEIENDNTKIKKSKNKLMMVENSREYHAMMRETDNLEKTNRMREEEKLAVDEDLATQTNLLNSVQSEIARLEEELQDIKQNLQVKLDEARNRLEELRRKREETVAEIPKPILSRYEFIRSRLNNPVIVPVKQGVCNGCNISIPPQVFVELQKGEQILSCPNCQRLVFWENHFSQEETAQESC